MTRRFPYRKSHYSNNHGEAQPGHIVDMIISEMKKDEKNAEEYRKRKNGELSWVTPDSN